MNAVIALPRHKPSKPFTCHVSATSLLRKYETQTQEETIENKIDKLEMQFDRYIQSILRSLLTSKEIQDMTKLSEASLRNIVTIQELATRMQQASEEE